MKNLARRFLCLALSLGLTLCCASYAVAQSSCELKPAEPVRVGLTLSDTALAERLSQETPTPSSPLWQGPIAQFWQQWAATGGCDLQLMGFNNEAEALIALEQGQLDYLGASSQRPLLAADGPISTAAYAHRAIWGFSREPIAQQHLVQGKDQVFVAAETWLTGSRRALVEDFFGARVLTSKEHQLGQWLQQQKADLVIVEGPLATAHPLNRFRRQVLWTRPLSAVAKNRTGAYWFYRVLKRMDVNSYFGEAVDGLYPQYPDLRLLSTAETLWRHDHPMITLGASQWAPLTNVQPNGEVSGVGIALVREHFQRMGVTPYFVADDQWPVVVDWAESGQIDGLGYAAKTVSVSSRLSFSDVLFESPWVILSPTDAPFLGDVPELHGQKVSISQGYDYVKFAGERYPDIEIVPYPDALSALQAAVDGEVKAVIESLPVAKTLIGQIGSAKLRVSLRLDAPGRFHSVLRSDWPELISLYNKSIGAMQLDQVNQILETSVSPSGETVTQIVRRTWIKLAPFFGLLLVLSAALAWRYRTVARTLHTRESHLRQVQNLARAGSMELVDGRLTVSPDMRALVGLEPSRKVSLADVINFYSKADGQALSSAFDDAQHGKSTDELELRLAQREPSDEPQIHRFSIRAMAGGKRILAAIVDVSAIRREQRESLELRSRILNLQKLESIGTLASGIAHDLNNTLTASIFHSEQALEKFTQQPAASEAIEQVIKANIRSRDLVKQILSFSSVDPAEAGQPISLNLHLEQSRQMLQGAMGADVSLKIGCKIDVWVQVSPDRLDQLLLNLCVNAANAMSHPGTVTITLDQLIDQPGITTRTGSLGPGDYALLEVSDDGCGMEPQVLERCLEPFFTTRSVHQGTGLGMSIVRGVVTSHGGAIAIASEVGTGTAVSIYLPVSNPAKSGSRLPTPSLPSVSLDGRQVMLVDDDALVLKAMTMMLERLGFQVYAFDDPTQALTALENKDYKVDILLTDFQMPIMNGMALASAARQLDSQLLIAIATGYPAEIIDQGVADGFVDLVLQKPILSKDLGEQLGQARPG